MAMVLPIVPGKALRDLGKAALGVKGSDELIDTAADATKKTIQKSTDDIIENAPKGGRYGKVRGGNQGGEVHHTPAAQVTPYRYRNAPSIWMETADHRKTASWGNSKAAQAYRSRQDSLIRSGNLRQAIQMDIDDIRLKFDDKYDTNIKEMLESLGFPE